MGPRAKLAPHSRRLIELSILYCDSGLVSLFRAILDLGDFGQADHNLHDTLAHL